MWQDTRLLNMVANVLYVFSTLLLLLLGVHWLIHRPMFDLQEIQIESSQRPLKYVSSLSINEVTANEIKGNFFTVDLNEVRSQFESVPWVRQVAVRRMWPNRLIVDIEEHEVLAIWNQGRLLSVKGEVFTANIGEADDDVKLAELSGPDGSEKLVAERYVQMLDWFKSVAPPISVSLSGRYAWQITLANGLSMDLGRNIEDDALGLELDESGKHMYEKIDGLLHVLPTVEAQLGKQIAHVDLRYPNGYAMRVATPPANPSGVQRH